MKYQVVAIVMLVFLQACMPPLTLHEQMERANAVEELLEASVLAMREQSLDDAENSLLLALELNEQDPRIHDGLGCVAWRRGELSRAAEYFNDALVYDPSYARAYVHLSLYEESKGNMKRAKELLERALVLNPLSVRGRVNYAGLLHESGRTNDARKEIGKAVVRSKGRDIVVDTQRQLIQGRDILLK